jgi:hypothetical protein
MTAYEVIASNKWFFQRLVVLADSEADAAAKFRARLSNPASIAHEEYEWEQTRQLEDDDPVSERSEYTYSFDSHRVEEFDGDPKWLGEPTADVQMISSGGNG